MSPFHRIVLLPRFSPARVAGIGIGISLCLALAGDACTRQNSDVSEVQRHKNRIAEIDTKLTDLGKEYKAALESGPGKLDQERRAQLASRLKELLAERKKETAAMYDAADIFKHPKPRPSLPSPTPR